MLVKPINHQALTMYRPSVSLEQQHYYHSQTQRQRERKRKIEAHTLTGWVVVVARCTLSTVTSTIVRSTATLTSCHVTTASQRPNTVTVTGYSHHTDPTLTPLTTHHHSHMLHTHYTVSQKREHQTHSGLSLIHI